MDPRYSFRKGYDTDLLILRSIFALDPRTNQAISSFYSPVADGIGGIQWLSLNQYFSAGTGILNFTSSVQSFSTITGLYSNFSTIAFSSFYTQNLVTSTISVFRISTQSITTSSLTFFDTTGLSTQRVMSFSSGSLYVNNILFYNPDTAYGSQLISTVAGLGTAKYISSTQFFSTIDRLGPGGYGYVNTPSLVSTTIGINNTTGRSLASTVVGLGTAGYISSSQLLSSLNGLATSGYVSSSQLISTVQGLGTAGYISSSQLLSTVAGLGGAGLISTGQLTSTLIGLGTYGYISSSQLTSTAAGLLVPTNLVSTVQGLGTAGYVSSSQLTSSIQGLGLVGYVSSSQLASTTSGIFASRQINTVSTVVGLGTAGYISTSQLVSTVIGLGGTGLISTGQLTSTTAGILGTNLPLALTSTVAGLGSAGYISTSQLVSTTIGLLAAIQPASGASVANLVSTVAGLGTAGYVSTAGLNTALTSTTIALQAGFFVVNANNVYVTNSRVSISTAGSVIVFSTFMNSSITYRGNSGQITGSNPGGATQPLYFSSATVDLDRWSSFIGPTSVVTLEAYPSFLFGNIIPSLGNPTLIYMSSFLQSGRTNFLSSQICESVIYPTQYSNGASNRFSQPLKITMPGAAVQSLYPNSMRLVHYLPNAITVGTTQGFSNSNVSIFYGSTNSLFLSIQNLTI